MTVKRSVPFIQDKVMPLIMEGKNVIIASHGNTLRAIIMYLMEYSSDQVLKTEVCARYLRLGVRRI
jgi:2,3-bisphosphoglycerate-dependent phosphoglycerate mutase